MHEILVNFLVKLAQEKVCLGQLGRKESNQTKKKKKNKKKTNLNQSVIGMCRKHSLFVICSIYLEEYALDCDSCNIQMVCAKIKFGKIETAGDAFFKIAIFYNKIRCLKIVRMNRKYLNHKLQTNTLHREEEPHNNHETPGRQTKQSNWSTLSSPSR